MVARRFQRAESRHFARKKQLATIRRVQQRLFAEAIAGKKSATLLRIIKRESPHALQTGQRVGPPMNTRG